MGSTNSYRRNQLDQNNLHIAQQRFAHICRQNRVDFECVDCCAWATILVRECEPGPDYTRAVVMHETFRDTDKAITWFLSGLTGQFENEHVEVICIEPQKVIRVFCDLSQVGGLLRQYCHRYKNATVHLHPDNKYGFVGEIRCHGNFDHHKADRPRVIVQLASVTNKELLAEPVAK